MYDDRDYKCVRCSVDCPIFNNMNILENLIDNDRMIFINDNGLDLYFKGEYLKRITKS